MTNHPRRIQLRRARGWRKPPGAIVVTRSTPWGNPFIVGRHGDRAECVAMFRDIATHRNVPGHINTRFERECIQRQHQLRRHLREHLQELRGHDLCCWCPTHKPCHADVLLDLANA